MGMLRPLGVQSPRRKEGKTAPNIFCYMNNERLTPAVTKAEQTVSRRFPFALGDRMVSGEEKQWNKE